MYVMTRLKIHAVKLVTSARCQ